MEKTIRRGDIYYADLNPVIGSALYLSSPMIQATSIVLRSLLPLSQAEYAQRQSYPRIPQLKISRVLAKTLLFCWSRYARLIRNG